MYTPNYLEQIQDDIKAMIPAAEKALEKLEKSDEYNDHSHPFHAAAVATYNRLISILLQIEGMEV